MKISLRNSILMILGVIILGLTIVVLENLREAQSVNRKYTSNILSSSEKHYVDEAFWLKKTTGNQVWPKFADTNIPVLLYNDRYEFLIGVPEPPDAWYKVEKDPFNGSGYYRRAVQNPQTFAVLVGERWVSSLSTRNVANRESYLNARNKFPPVIAQLYPYQYATVTPDLHVVTILQEQFHAFQAMESPLHFESAVKSYKDEKNYPYDNSTISKLWNQEGFLLWKAMTTSNVDTMKTCVRRFLHVRSMRRTSAGMGEKQVAIEQNIEWLDGLAKYTGYRFYELATVRREKPVFVHYRKQNPRLLQDYAQIRRGLGKVKNDYRFYLSGLAQALILDKLNIDWKPAILSDETNLEDLLAKGITH